MIKILRKLTYFYEWITKNIYIYRKQAYHTENWNIFWVLELISITIKEIRRKMMIWFEKWDSGLFIQVLDLDELFVNWEITLIREGSCINSIQGSQVLRTLARWSLIFCVRDLSNLQTNYIHSFKFIWFHRITIIKLVPRLLK